MMFFLGQPALAAEETMDYVYAGPNSPQDLRHEYRMALLKAALERTSEAQGAFTLKSAKGPPMLESRQVEELLRSDGGLTVICRSISPEMERQLLPVRIPVNRGLTGYRVFVIRKEDRPKFAAARTLDDLRKFTYGVEVWRLEEDILKAAGFQVVTGTDFDGLFRMLANGRFDALPRPITVVREELGKRREKVPGLAIEKDVVLHYPLPLYFWFAKTDDGRKLAARVEEGLVDLLKDGTFEQIFFTYFGRQIADLDLKNRQLFRIDNPLLDHPVPEKDKRLWFDPLRDSVPAAVLIPATGPADR